MLIIVRRFDERMAFVPEGQADPSQHDVPVCVLAPAISPEGARKLSPGFTLAKRKRTFCPEGARSGRDPIKRFGGESRPYLVAPSGLIRAGNYRAKLFWPLRATD